MQIKLPSLELNWLSKLDRSLPMPEVAYFKGHEIDFWGKYYPPWKGEEKIGNEFYDRKNGIIAIADHGLPDIWWHLGSVLAHEYRHHWQWRNGHQWDNNILDPFTEIENLGYELGTYTYYTQPHELDALKFQFLRQPCEAIDYVVEILADPNKFGIDKPPLIKYPF